MSPDAPDTQLPVNATDSFPETLPVLPLRDTVAFPMSLLPVQVGHPGDAQLIREVGKGNRLFVLVTQRDAQSDERAPEAYYEIGCGARILQMQDQGEQGLQVVVQALRRVRLMGTVRREPYLVAKIETLREPDVPQKDLLPLAATVKAQMANLIALSPGIPDAAQQVVNNIEDAGFLADLVASNLNVRTAEKQELLSTLDPRDRLLRLTRILARELEILEASNKIQQDVRESIDKNQREFYLRQQMKAIQTELGEGTGPEQTVEIYREKLGALSLGEEVRREVNRELERLARMNEASAEFQVVATYLDTILELPWGTYTSDRLDLRRAEDILEEDHYGLPRVKRRILEYLAVRKLKEDAGGPILCFVGPPGVGKTSLGRSIARALDRRFIRMALGGMRDEAEIRGHRRTYVGAAPGRIIQSIRKAGSMNPVFILDEIDKLGQSMQGDPASALLEVLDPAQNDSFVDHYLNVPFDLSHVLFIATANVLDAIPWALRDRMEVIEIAGYTEEEKMEIARRYLVPRQLSENGLNARQLKFNKTALRHIISGYTREAGVRNLEREIGGIARGCARKFATHRRKPIRITEDAVREYLGPPRIPNEVVERTRVPGVAIGLAWTAVGGDILFIEATRMPGKGRLTLTGQLGDVMKESVQAALSYIRANAKSLGLGDTDFDSFDIHVHVPAGAVPKDGPSAGVTMLTAIVSMLTGKRVKHHLAMTGEITLRGNVLAVGGIKEKVLAAARAGVKEVILPEAAAYQLEEVPESVREKLALHPVTRMHEVLEIALGLRSDG